MDWVKDISILNKYADIPRVAISRSPNLALWFFFLLCINLCISDVCEYRTVLINALVSLVCDE